MPGLRFSIVDVDLSIYDEVEDWLRDAGLGSILVQEGTRIHYALTPRLFWVSGGKMIWWGRYLGFSDEGIRLLSRQFFGDS